MTAENRVDTLTAPQMAVWIRETAANTRVHSDTDRLAAHVAFRLEQAADLLERQHTGLGLAREWLSGWASAEPYIDRIEEILGLPADVNANVPAGTPAAGVSSGDETTGVPDPRSGDA